MHGARAALLVGDHRQLPPFTRWQGARECGYDVSLMERMTQSAKFPQFMLREQYRMHPAMCRVVSDSFYRGQLCTAAATSPRRTHPLPTCFIESGGADEKDWTLALTITLILTQP